MAREIFVVIGALGDGDAGRRLFLEALQYGIDVVRALFLELREKVEHESREAALVGARLGDQGQVGRQCAAIGDARSLLVGEWRGKVIGGPGGPLAQFSLVLRAVLDLVFGCERRPLPSRVPRT